MLMMLLLVQVFPFWQRDDAQVSWLNVSIRLCLIVNICTGDNRLGFWIHCHVCGYSEYASETKIPNVEGNHVRSLEVGFSPWPVECLGLGLSF